MVPDWYKRQVRQQALADARLLDPDLASLRSISVSVKISIQAERNYSRRMSGLAQELLDNNAAGRFWGWFSGSSVP